VVLIAAHLNEEVSDCGIWTILMALLLTAKKLNKTNKQQQKYTQTNPSNNKHLNGSHRCPSKCRNY